MGDIVIDSYSSRKLKGYKWTWLNEQVNGFNASVGATPHAQYDEMESQQPENLTFGFEMASWMKIQSMKLIILEMSVKLLTEYEHMILDNAHSSGNYLYTFGILNTSTSENGQIKT